MNERLLDTLRRCGAPRPPAPEWEAAALERVRAWAASREGGVPSRGSFAPLLEDFRAWEEAQGLRPCEIPGKAGFSRLLVAIGARTSAARVKKQSESCKAETAKRRSGR